MYHIYPFLISALCFASQVASIKEQPGLWYSSRERRSGLRLRRQIVNTLNISAVSTDPELDGLADVIDPTADIATYFPTESGLESTTAGTAGNTATSKRSVLFRKENTVAWTNETTNTDWNITFSGCVSAGDQVLGPWQFDNGSSTDTAKWVDILIDAKNVYKKYGGINAALDAGLERNIALLQQNVTAIIGAGFYDDSNTTSGANSSTTATQGGIQETNTQDIVTSDYNEGKNELRKLLQVDAWLPSWRAVTFVGVGTALNYGIITGFSILGSLSQGQNITFQNHAAGLGAAALFFSLAVLGWLTSDKLRTAFNRLTASGAVATTREQANRALGQLIGRDVGGVSAQNNPGEDASLPGTNSVFSNPQPVTANLANTDIEMGNFPQEPLSGVARAADYLINTSDELLGIIPGDQALSDLVQQSTSDPNSCSQ